MESPLASLLHFFSLIGSNMSVLSHDLCSLKTNEPCSTLLHLFLSLSFQMVSDRIAAGFTSCLVFFMWGHQTDSVLCPRTALPEDCIVETPAFTDSVRLYRQAKGHYGSWDMMCGAAPQVRVSDGTAQLRAEAWSAPPHKRLCR